MLDFLFNNLSYIGIIALLVAGVILPIPEELVVIAAGLAASYGQLNPWLAFAACLGGALAGDCLLYVLGYHFGHGVLRETRFVGRFLRPERELRMERMIRAHGLKVLFAARFMVGLRSTAYLAAGILRMPFRRFVVVDIVCATTVIGLVFSLSYVYAWRLGELGLLDMVRDAEVALTVLIVLLVAALVLFYWRRHQQRLTRIRLKQQRRASRLETIQREAVEQIPEREETGARS